MNDHDARSPRVGDAERPGTSGLDPELATIASDLATQLEARANTIQSEPPATALLVDRADVARASVDHRRRQLLVAAAAILTLVIVSSFAMRGRPDEHVLVGDGDPRPTTAVDPPSTVSAPSPLYLAMDAPGFSLMSAESTGDPTPGATPTASDGSTGPSTRDTHSVVIAKTDAAGGAARAPLLLIRVFQMNPAGTSEVPGTTGASETRVTPIGPDIVGAQRTVPNAVVQAYGWGLSSDAVAAATSSVSMHRDGSFDVGAPPEGLTTFAVPPSGEPEVANTVGYATAMTEYTSRTQGHATLSVRSGTTAWVQSLQDILSVPSGSDVGSPVVTNRTIMGRPALLRTEVHASGRTSFLAVWEVPDRQATVEIRGSLEAGTEVEATLASIHPVDDETWQEMARRCPGPMHAQGTPPSTAIGSC